MSGASMHLENREHLAGGGVHRHHTEPRPAGGRMHVHVPGRQRAALRMLADAVPDHDLLELVIHHRVAVREGLLGHQPGGRSVRAADPGHVLGQSPHEVPRTAGPPQIQQRAPVLLAGRLAGSQALQPALQPGDARDQGQLALRLMDAHQVGPRVVLAPEDHQAHALGVRPQRQQHGAARAARSRLQDGLRQVDHGDAAPEDDGHAGRLHHPLQLGSLVNGQAQQGRHEGRRAARDAHDLDRRRLLAPQQHRTTLRAGRLHQVR